MIAMISPRIVLASASPRRRDLLAELGLPFTVAATDVDEDAIARAFAGDPLALAARLARAKLDAHPASVAEAVLAADTIVAIDGRILGKPGDAAEAWRMLRDLRGRSHTVVTAIALRAGPGVSSDVANARVVMRPYTDAEMAAYIERGEPFDKAGGYAIQDAGFAPVAELDGCRCAVIGLPLWRTAMLLRRAGFAAADPPVPRCGDCPDRALSAGQTAAGP